MCIEMCIEIESLESTSTWQVMAISADGTRDANECPPLMPARPGHGGLKAHARGHLG
jgi:hypothetical protein